MSPETRYTEMWKTEEIADFMRVLPFYSPEGRDVLREKYSSIVQDIERDLTQSDLTDEIRVAFIILKTTFEKKILLL